MRVLGANLRIQTEIHRKVRTAAVYAKSLVLTPRRLRRADGRQRQQGSETDRYDTATPAADHHPKSPLATRLFALDGRLRRELRAIISATGFMKSEYLALSGGNNQNINASRTPLEATPGLLFPADAVAAAVAYFVLQWRAVDEVAYAAERRTRDIRQRLAREEPLMRRQQNIVECQQSSQNVVFQHLSREILEDCRHPRRRRNPRRHHRRRTRHRPDPRAAPRPRRGTDRRRRRRPHPRPPHHRRRRHGSRPRPPRPRRARVGGQAQGRGSWRKAPPCLLLRQQPDFFHPVIPVDYIFRPAVLLRHFPPH